MEVTDTMAHEAEHNRRVEELRRRYQAALHAMQSGVAMWMNYEPEPKETGPKYLRLGVNSALCDSGALLNLLIAKGVINEVEYYEAVTEAVERDVESYRTLIAGHLGLDPTNVELV